MLDRPEWNDYFMALALIVSQRSIDPATKHGTVVVDDENTPLSFGYNSPPRGCRDDLIPLTRPEKYPYFIHSEEAAIANAARVGVPLRGSTFYVTGRPCEKCTGMIINAGAKKVIYGNISAKCITKESLVVIDMLLMGQNIEFVHYREADIVGQLESAIAYYKRKEGENNG